MADQQNDNANQKGDRERKSQDASPKAVRQVVVKPLDEPPPPGKQEIHPRRPAPIVPTREERTGKQPEEDRNREKPDSEERNRD
jgi:hypothetical protein